MSLYKCPICGGPMLGGPMCYEETQNIYTCPVCSFAINCKTQEGYMLPGAKRNLQDSFEFLFEFARCKPIYAFNTNQLFSENFKLQDTVFIGCKTASDVVNCSDIDRVNIQRDVVSKVLIGGCCTLSYKLFEYFTKGITAGVNILANSMYEDVVFDAKTYLFAICMLESSTVDVTQKTVDAARAFFAPCFEYAVANMTQVLPHSSYYFTDELCLYSHIVCTPTVNIKYSNTPELLYRNMLDYCRAVCKDIDTTTLNKEVVRPGNIPDKWYDDLYNMHLQSMPSTALNNGASFCILNHKCMNDPFEGFNINNDKSLLRYVVSTYRLNAELYNKYAKDLCSHYNLTAKAKWLQRLGANVVIPTDKDELVLSFWRYVAMDILGE